MIGRAQGEKVKGGSDGSWCSKESAYYPPELNRRLAVAMCDSLAKRHVVDALETDFGVSSVSPDAPFVGDSADWQALPKPMTWASAKAYGDSKARIDRHADAVIDAAEPETIRKGGPRLGLGVCARSGELVRTSLELLTCVSAIAGHVSGMHWCAYAPL
eukprot:scaffold7432_cov107-Isochrysis_galbana.AAC.6